MKKLFRNIGITAIICLSFLISEKTAIVVKDVDDNLIELKKIENQYYEPAKNATIKNNTIIPGKYGKKINIDKTYKEIKKIGQINEKYFIYDQIKPEISIENNYDKYIIRGNPEKQSVSIVFIIKSKDNINSISEILEQEKINVTFFLEDEWINQNKDTLKKIIKKGNRIERLNTDKSTQKTRIEEANSGYCYTSTENEKILNNCQKEKKYTIKQNPITEINPLKEIKKEITNGSIIVLTVNEKINQELNMIIKYIKSKGYNLEKLDELLSEKFE